MILSGLTTNLKGKSCEENRLGCRALLYYFHIFSKNTAEYNCENKIKPEPS